MTDHPIPPSDRNDIEGDAAAMPRSPDPYAIRVTVWFGGKMLTQAVFDRHTRKFTADACHIEVDFLRGDLYDLR